MWLLVFAASNYKLEASGEILSCLTFKLRHSKSLKFVNIDKSIIFKKKVICNSEGKKLNLEIREQIKKEFCSTGDSSSL